MYIIKGGYMIDKIRSFFRCKLSNKHIFIQDKDELGGPNTVKIYYKCKLCGKEVYQTIHVGFDNIKRSGKIEWTRSSDII